MGEDAAINESHTEPDTAQEDANVGAVVSVRAAADATETELRAEAERHLPTGWQLGELLRQYPDGDEVVFEFDAVAAS